MTRIWIAICIYLLLAYIKFIGQIVNSLQPMLRLLQLNLFERRELQALLDVICQNQKPQLYQTTLRFS